MSDTESKSSPGRFLRSLGPAIVVACVVLGPGSILTSSKVGVTHGYGMIWVLVLAGVLMFGMTALAARLGVTFEGSLCDELRARLGKPAAIVVGVVLFGIVACFQFSNNIGVLAGLEPFFKDHPAWKTIQVAVLVGLNGVIIGVIFGFKNLYRPIEIIMMVMMGLMLLSFAVNLAFAKPDFSKIFSGLVPRVPGSSFAELLPLFGMVATTFSIGGAFYQGYAVRERGWTTANFKDGLIDSLVGITVLTGITMMIMITSASVLHGQIEPGELKSAGDVALQLGPLFGDSAKMLFCQGILAGAFSSFLVNAMIGGTLLSDGLGLGSKLDGTWPKRFTVLALLSGMGVALLMKTTDLSIVNLIIFAQALTVVGGPVLAGSLLYLAFRPDLQGDRRVPGWIKTIGCIGFGVTVVLAIRTINSIIGKLSG
jgi:manganese transport protein